MNTTGPVTVGKGKKEGVLNREDLEFQIPLDNKKQKILQHASSDEALFTSAFLYCSGQGLAFQALALNRNDLFVRDKNSNNWPSCCLKVTNLSALTLIIRCF